MIYKLKSQNPVTILFTNVYVYVYVPCAISLDEIHSWCDPGHTGRLFNHPPSAAKPFSPGKDRQQLEPILQCISWVILWYV